MSEPFVMRAVHGKHVGNYYVGVEGLSAKWTDSPVNAKRLSPEDAAGIAMAILDTECVAVVPEVAGECTEGHREAFAYRMARGCFQSPDGGMAPTIKLGIRDSESDPIHPQSDCPEPTGYMSVWEWVMRAIAARLGDSNG